ncbi:hypothetical protein acsn021_37100 [Anaerocolumna cellulosilytica]|uniref:Uncharacterized protein n=1 Tax=Anaerocolumna cellulosilytica TaxID=433286 RepID=A0A6S6RBH5_9FIRM|nr:hypothetical protein [Anaerocolumna cellulosilytica]MBB5195022.1 hypothetical protein [Anaerocolumna cellulosilytica]BCJ96141.1 hypothetical protein acsn021_37100 [Anaerocolumna cellulosilytica]
MKKLKRILALTAVIILVSLYIVTLVAAFISSPSSNTLFKASIFCTVTIPIMMYGYLLVHRLVKGKSEDDSVK